MQFLENSSKVFGTKTQHGLLYDLPQGLGVLIWYFRGIVFFILG